MTKAFYKAIVLSLATVSIMAFSTKYVAAAEETEAVADEAVLDGTELYDEINNGENYGDNEGIMLIDEEGGEAVASDSIPGPDGTMIQTVIPDENVPKLFHKTTTTYQGTQVESAQFDNGYIQILLVTDAQGIADFMCYNEATGELSAFRPIYSAEDRFIIVLPISEAVVIPEGFTEVVLDWKGQNLPAYIDAESEAAPGSAMPSDFILVYAINSQGAEGLYTYDQNEGTYQRYVTFGNSSQDAEKLIDFAAVKDGDRQAIIKLAIIGTMGILILILLILVIVLSVRLKDYSGYEYIDEDEYRANMGGQSEYNRAERTAPARRRMVEEDEDEDDDEEGVPVSGRTTMQGQNPQSRPAAAQIQNPQSRPAAAQTQNPQEASRDTGREENRETRRPERPTRQQASDAARRRALLETTDIADLDDILNDPNLTSNLPLPSQIEAAARQMAIAEQKKAEAAKVSYDDMQVTVDNYGAGMPAMVDTEMIKRNTGGIPVEEIAGEEQDYESRRESYLRDDEYQGGRYEGSYEGDEDDDEDDYYYLSRAEKKERKLLEKQRRREEKEAERDAKFYERERKRAEKRRRRGYDDPEAMDWSQLQDDMRGNSNDDRRPMGYRQEELPSYVRRDMGEMPVSEAVPSGSDYPEQSTNSNRPKAPKREYTEEERADAAAEAVIAAARGPVEEEPVRQSTAAADNGAYRQPPVESEQNQDAYTQPSAPATQYTQDLDEDFEFEFLNIRRPQ